MSEIEERIGRRLRDARRAAHLTQEQLAERIGVSVETIGRVERGTQIPPIGRLEEAAQTVGVELADLVRPTATRGRREKAIGRLVSLLRGRSAEDAELVAAIADLIFRRRL